jgi:hypothetical protein
MIKPITLLLGSCLTIVIIIGFLAKGYLWIPGAIYLVWLIIILHEFES